jgi:hypothetical protein
VVTKAPDIATVVAVAAAASEVVAAVVTSLMYIGIGLVIA